MKSRIFAALLLLVGLAALGRPAWSCTRVLWSTSGQSILVARTMDLFMSDQATIRVTPRGHLQHPFAGSTVRPWTTRYGSVSVSAAGVSSSDGLNERGLVVNQLYLSGSQFEQPNGKPALSNISLVAYLLDNFATVQEAVNGLQQLQIFSSNVLSHDWPTHVAIADATGDSAIVEFIDGKPAYHRGRDLRVMTNEPKLEDQMANLKKYVTFGGGLPIPGGIDPASRFVRASFFLKSLAPAKSQVEALSKIFSVINAEAVPFDAQVGATPEDSEDQWPTLWTTVADSTRKVYYFRSTTSPYLYWVDLTRLNLKPGRGVTEVDAYRDDLAGDITSLLR